MSQAHEQSHTCDSSCKNPRTRAWSSCDVAPWLDDSASLFKPSCRLRRPAAMSAGTLIDWESLHVRYWLGCPPGHLVEHERPARQLMRRPGEVLVLKTPHLFRGLSVPWVPLLSGLEGYDP